MPFMQPVSASQKERLGDQGEGFALRLRGLGWCLSLGFRACVKVRVEVFKVWIWGLRGGATSYRVLMHGLGQGPIRFQVHCWLIILSLGDF